MHVRAGAGAAAARFGAPACYRVSQSTSHRQHSYTDLIHLGYVLALPTIWTARTPFLNVATEPETILFKVLCLIFFNLFIVGHNTQIKIYLCRHGCKAKDSFFSIVADRETSKTSDYLIPKQLNNGAEERKKETDKFKIIKGNRSLMK